LPDFDPTTVPPFPVVTLDLRDDSSITVDGKPVHIDMDQPPTEAGIAAVAEIARSYGVEAIRVRATSPDGTHLMVITADGVAHDTTPPELTKSRKLGTRRIIAGSAILATMLLVAGGAVAFVIGAQPEPAPVSTNPSQPPGHLANLPVLAPPGYGQKAAWSVPVQSRATPLLLDEDRIVVVDQEGNLAILDAATGATTWRGAGAPTGQAGIHATSVEDRPVLATSSSTTLTLWPLDTKETTRIKGTAVDLGANGDVSYLGSAPLVTLTNQTVALLTEDGIKRVDVPVTATAILATQDSAIAANAESWWTIPASGEPTRHALPIPSEANPEESPVLVSAGDDTHLIVVWLTADPSVDVATVVDLDGNAIVAQAPVPSGAVRGDSEPIHARSDDTLTVGQIFINYGAEPAVIALDEFTPSVVDGTTLYGKTDRAPAVAKLEGDAFSISPFTTLSTDNTAVPVAVTPGRAYVVAEKVEETFLYALPPESREEK
jgi:hypothetical protein